MKARASGFTLLEMIGVMAVIAIIAAIATPRIFDAIEDAKVTALVQQANDLRANVADYYKDTGRWPRHIPNHKDDRYHNLLVNKGTDGKAIAGWDGPYLDQELSHPLATGEYQELVVTDNNAYACDLDGNGSQDGKFVIYRLDGIDDTIAKKVSHMMDKDGGIDSGSKGWREGGRVKRYNGNHTSILLFCLATV